MVPH
jgi:hypothetical protein